MTATTRPLNPTMTFLGVLLAVFGLAFAVLAAALPEWLLRLYTLIATEGVVPDVGPTARLATGIYGGLMVGWGVMIAAFGRGQSARRATLVGALSWFVVDGTCSALTGFAWNVASNALFLLPFVLLLPTARSSRKA